MHPNETIMRELIQDQWMKDSIFAAIVDSNGNIVSKGRTIGLGLCPALTIGKCNNQFD